VKKDQPIEKVKPAPIPITVVAAEQALALPDEEAGLARLQIAGSDLIVLNKVDLVDIAQLAEVQAWIKEMRPGVQILEATHCRLPLEILGGQCNRSGNGKIADSQPGTCP
jgi:G3E family GTPase